MTFVERVLLGFVSKDLFAAAIPSELGMLM